MTSLLHHVCRVICWFSDSLLTYGGGQLGPAAASELAGNLASIPEPRISPALVTNHRPEPSPDGGPRLWTALRCHELARRQRETGGLLLVTCLRARAS